MPHVPLTIVLVTDHAYMSGGVSMVVFESAAGLLKAGHRPVIVAAAGPVDRQAIPEGVELVCLEQRDLLSNPSRLNAMLTGLWNVSAARQLEDYLKLCPSDRTIVHLHGWTKAYSPSVFHAIERSKLPCVHTLHDFSFFCPNAGYYNYPKKHNCTLIPMSGSCLVSNCDMRHYTHKLWRYTRQAVGMTIANMHHVAQDVIILSQLQRELTADWFPKGMRVHQIGNPIKAQDWGQKPQPTSGRLIYVGRLSIEKGPLLYAQACRQLGIVPLFVGDGPLKGRILAEYPEADITGWQNNDAVRQALREARVLVFPSLLHESQGLTPLESLALGTPCIVPDQCAARESVTDGVTGLWFKAGDVNDLARAMMELREDDARVAQMSQAAYEGYWANPPTLEKHVEALIKVYEQVMKEAAAAHILQTMQSPIHVDNIKSMIEEGRD